MALPLHIVLGITGSIAAYKACELVRQLRAKGSSVRVVMTEHAKQFITPLTLQALSGHPVHTALLDTEAEAAMSHIDLARWADLLLIAPATASTLAKMAHGFADDLLTTVYLATAAPVAVAPAMNQQMYHNDATQQNLKILDARGVQVLGPATGTQACGDLGWGRFIEPEAIVEALEQESTAYLPLTGRTVLVTAGPTREAIDPIRYISNHSSGKMGFAVAAAARDAGARVILISGPTFQEPPKGVELLCVESAEQMYAAVFQKVDKSDIVIATAAVADYKPAVVLAHKLKKHQHAWKLLLEKTPDIIGAVASLTQNRPFCVGFAAETENGPQYARAKLEHKNLDMIALNAIGKPDIGFHADTNALTVFFKGGQCEIPFGSKPAVATQLIQLVSQIFYAQNKSQDLECADR